MAGLRIVDETPADFQAVRRINEAAFDTRAEAELVEVLRERAKPLISLVAEDEGAIAGHILFTPVTIADCDARLFGLAPMAVDPTRQRAGIGSVLVREGLSRCEQLGAAGVVVLGHPGYYPRFGFRPASAFGITSEYDVPDAAFMALELAAGSLDCVCGVARYHPAFAGL